MDRPAVSVSVVIPAHNAAATVAESIRSALCQEPAPAQVVVVDDGSTDDTGDVARASGARVLRHSKARGAAAARDVGARATTADLVSFLDADDQLAEGYVAAVLRAHAEHPHAPLIVGQSVEHHPDGSVRHPAPYNARQLAHPVMALAWDNRVPTSASTVPRWAYLQSGGFDADFPGSAAEDFDLWLRLARLGPFAAAPGARVHRTITGGSTSRRPDAADLMLRNGLLCVVRNRDAAAPVYPPFARVATAHIFREAALRCLDAGDDDGAVVQLGQALRANPVDVRLWSACALWLTPRGLRRALLAARQRALSWRHQDDLHPDR